MTISEETILQQATLVESFLGEFCKVNEIKEEELKDTLSVVTLLSDNAIMAVSVDDVKDVKFGVKFKVKNDEGMFSLTFEVFGDYIHNKEYYPETTRLLNEFTHGRGCKTTA